MRYFLCLLLINVVLAEHHWLRGKPGQHGTLAAASAPAAAPRKLLPIGEGAYQDPNAVGQRTTDARKHCEKGQWNDCYNDKGDYLDGHSYGNHKAATLVQKSVGKGKGLVNFMRGVKTPEALIDHKEFGLMSVGEIFVTFACWLCLYALCAAYYHNYVLYYAPPVPSKEEKNSRDNYRDFQDFKSGLCALNNASGSTTFDSTFTEFPGICFWSCLCPGIRWADTMSKLGIHKFWPAFWFLTVLYCISFIPLATIPCFVIVVSYMTYHRQKFREKFNFDDQGGSSCVKDCFTYCLCMCCAVAQEARHSRQACLAAHPAIQVEGQAA